MIVVADTLCTCLVCISVIFVYICGETSVLYLLTVSIYRFRLIYIDYCSFFFFFFQAEDGIRDLTVTGVQTCALPIYGGLPPVTSGAGTGGSPPSRVASGWWREAHSVS